MIHVIRPFSPGVMSGRVARIEERGQPCPREPYALKQAEIVRTYQRADSAVRAPGLWEHALETAANARRHVREERRIHPAAVQLVHVFAG